MEKKMFNKANALIFTRAKELRSRTTEAEIVLWEFLKTKPSGYKFRRQHPFGLYIVDFFCYKLKLAIEIDGLIHNRGDIKLKDKNRQSAIESKGISVIRFTNEEVINSIEKVIAKIQSYFPSSVGAGKVSLLGAGVLSPLGAGALSPLGAGALSPLGAGEGARQNSPLGAGQNSPLGAGV